jgi:hypothetical protein
VESREYPNPLQGTYDRLKQLEEDNERYKIALKDLKQYFEYRGETNTTAYKVVKSALSFHLERKK